ncbi:MAG: VanW family protein [bacterium]|nr:VanW family protein [bacterium]
MSEENNNTNINNNDDELLQSADEYDYTDDFFDNEAEEIISNTEEGSFAGADYKAESSIGKDMTAKKKHLRFIKPILIVLAALLGVFVIVLTFCIATLPKNTVANNIMIENLDVSGLSYDETLAAVEATHLFENRDITIECGGQTRTLSGKELELCAIPEATAQKAFLYCKSGNILKDGLAAMHLLIGKKVIVPVADINHDTLNLKLGEFGNEVCGTLTQTSVDFTDTEAIITPGTPGFDYNTDTAREEILDAIINERFDNIHITLNTVQPDKVNVDYIDTAIYRDPIDAYYAINGNDIMVIAEVYGRYCNRADIEAIIDKINTPGGEPLSIPYQSVTPNVLSADLSAKLFNSTLGSYSTSYYSGGNRGKNVARAAELINGKILAPGEEFSFNDTVGDRTQENGFFTAPEYAAGQSVEGIGGGTCQVSSTLYSAVLYADLGITSRTEHMMTVGYIPAGQDATVAYGSIDFKFKNTTDYPLKIVSTTGGGKVSVSIVGTAWEPAREVKLKHSVSTEGENTVVYSKRLVYSEGKLISEDVLDSSSYAPHQPADTSDDDD